MALRNKEGVFSVENIQGIKGDIGDVLWYLSRFAKELGLKFDDVAKYNIEKLKDRSERGVLKTEGVKS